MRNKWTPAQHGNSNRPGVWDQNGVTRTHEVCAAFPGVERVTVESYCGREYQDNCRYYVKDGVEQDGERVCFATLREAIDALTEA